MKNSQIKAFRRGNMCSEWEIPYFRITIYKCQSGANECRGERRAIKGNAEHNILQEQTGKHEYQTRAWERGGAVWQAIAIIDYFGQHFGWSFGWFEHMAHTLLNK